MTCQTSTNDVIACVLVSTVLFGASLVPFFLLVEAEHLLPRVVRELPSTAESAVRSVALNGAALLMLLTPAAAPEATR